ncbi:DUF421 domain-containing protein [Chitinophaga filiformis]|uniref:YetF domain-containing protein n=1 Tax=Chitinophaga filiformis TaxID=104663 RepID=UPI001F2DAA43|nr:YetF domain-containing protein [Chitinophaga filiformis]MCF6407859.1 DUF421 domain-containing protein [Chitinophaga filiformis]
MEKSEIFITDIGRILSGDTPAGFFIEIIIRGIIVYLILMGALRLMGKRMATRLNRNELAAISTLAAAVGIPLFSPDRGVLPGIIIGGIVVLVQRLIAYLGRKNERFERLSQGKISTLIHNGCLQMDEMKKTRVSREQLFAQLRTNKVIHLGEVKRVFMEANGAFTIVRNVEKQPGLTVLPTFDKEFIGEQDTTKTIVCNYCGDTASPGQPSCRNCGWQETTNAVM